LPQSTTIQTVQLREIRSNRVLQKHSWSQWDEVQGVFGDVSQRSRVHDGLCFTQTGFHLDIVQLPVPKHPLKQVLEAPDKPLPKSAPPRCCRRIKNPLDLLEIGTSFHFIPVYSAEQIVRSHKVSAVITVDNVGPTSPTNKSGKRQNEVHGTYRFYQLQMNSSVYSTGKQND